MKLGTETEEVIVPFGSGSRLVVIQQVTARVQMDGLQKELSFLS